MPEGHLVSQPEARANGDTVRDRHLSRREIEGSNEAEVLRETGGGRADEGDAYRSEADARAVRAPPPGKEDSGLGGGRRGHPRSARRAIPRRARFLLRTRRVGLHRAASEDLGGAFPAPRLARAPKSGEVDRPEIDAVKGL